MAGDTPGPAPILEDKELLKKIKECILNGCDLKKTAEISGLNIDSFYVWHSDNYLGIKDKIEGWKRDRKLMLANRNIEEILNLPRDDKDFVKTVSDMTKFVAETLDKTNYSKRNELTGKDGEALQAQPILVKFIDTNENREDNTDTNRVQETV